MDDQFDPCYTIQFEQFGEPIILLAWLVTCEFCFVVGALGVQGWNVDLSTDSISVL